MVWEDIIGHVGKQGRREGKGNFLNHLNKFTIGAIIIIILVTRAFQHQLLDAVLVEMDGVVQDLAFEQKDIEVIAVGLCEEEFVRNTRIRLFDGSICCGNGLRSIREFLDSGVIVEVEDLENVVVEEVEIKGLVALGTHLGRGHSVTEGCLPLEESASK